MSNAQYMREWRAKRKAAGLPTEYRTDEQKRARALAGLARYHEKRREQKLEFQQRPRRGTPDHVWRNALRRNYDTTPEFIYDLYLAQRKLCCLCRQEIAEPGTGAGGVHIDHCHSSGRIRGILCQPCNHMLGLAKDSAETLLRAAAYLKEHQSV
jgi:Recombination endonuclease VII